MKKNNVKVIVFMILLALVLLVFKMTTNNSSDSSNSNNLSVASEKGKVASFDNEKFMNAVLENDLSTVNKMILEDGFNPNYIFEDGKVFFENTLYFMNIEMAKILLDAGTDPSLVTSNGQSILERVEECDNIAMKKLISKYIK